MKGGRERGEGRWRECMREAERNTKEAVKELSIHISSVNYTAVHMYSSCTMYVVLYGIILHTMHVLHYIVLYYYIV